MKRVFAFITLSLYIISLLANNIKGTMRGANNTLLTGVKITVLTLQEGHIVAGVQSQADGSFIVKEISAGRYSLVCSYDGYADYTAEIEVNKDDNLSLGTLVMYPKGVQLEEAVVGIHRNVFTANKQTLYPSKQQVETSNSGLELLQKLPIPLLEVNPFYRSITSLDPSGDVATLINDIPADANEVVALDPKQIRRVEVIRKPGTKYGDHLAMAINIVLKQARNGISLGVNTTNSTLLKSGRNNAFATYTREHSQFSINQNEDYQNYSHQETEDFRQYLLPNGNWHKVEQQSLSRRILSATHGTTLKYNLTQPDNLVLQVQGYLTLQRTPKSENSFIVRETGKNDYTYRTQNPDEYNSPALNLYFKKYLPSEQQLVFNAVGTSISSHYYYRSNQEGKEQTNYGVEGRKMSVIGEVKYSKDFEWGSLTCGTRSFYENTNNHYIGNMTHEGKMINLNSKAYVQLNGQWKKLSGSTVLAIEDQYYKQKSDHYHKQMFSPSAKLDYYINQYLSMGYDFNLASRLPELSNMNDVAYQIDQWERRVGNSQLKPFNHIEHSLRMAYYNQKYYAMLLGTYAYNKNAIMPTLTRTEENNGLVFFDNGVGNQRDFKQWVLTAYLRYAAIQNKLILSGTGSYIYYHADSKLYNNHRGFFYGNLSVESYLGNFYLSANVSSRYNALYAESIWYNEYTSSLSATYKWKNCQVGLMWEQPLQSNGTNSSVETTNNVVQKIQRQRNLEAGNHILLTFSWRWDYGFKSKAQDADFDNKDTKAGILK